MERRNGMKGWGRTLVVSVVILVISSLIGGVAVAKKRYVGSKACADCHEEEYNNFTKYAKKARSFDSVMKMKKDLSAQELKGCFKCHTTGYGEPGGFQSVEKTPQLKDAGCEVCHGPGSKHVESEDPDDIKGKLSFHDCEGCHIPSIAKEFNFKPLIHGGAH